MHVCMYVNACTDCVSAATDSQSLSGNSAISLQEGTEEARIVCHLDSAMDSTGFDWSGPAITTDNRSSGKVRIENEGTASTLFIRSVEGSDAGTYVCTHSLVSGDGLQITLKVTCKLYKKKTCIAI